MATRMSQQETKTSFLPREEWSSLVSWLAALLEEMLLITLVMAAGAVSVEKVPQLTMWTGAVEPMTCAMRISERPVSALLILQSTWCHIQQKAAQSADQLPTTGFGANVVMLCANVMPRPPNVLPAILTTRNIKVTPSRNATKDVFLNIGWTDEIKSLLNPRLVYIYCKIIIPQIKASKYGANQLCNVRSQNINLTCFFTIVWTKQNKRAIPALTYSSNE